MINSSEGSDILVFNCYLCHVRFLLVYYFDSIKIGEISDMSKCLEDFVSQALGVLTRNNAAELRYKKVIGIVIGLAIGFFLCIDDLITRLSRTFDKTR